MATDLNLGKAEVILSAVSGGFTKAMSGAISQFQQVQSQAEQFGSVMVGMGVKLTAIGMSMAGSILGATKAYATMGSNLTDMAARTGVSVEALSELEYALSTSGMSLDQMELSFRRFQMMMYSAQRGEAGMTKMFKQLNLNFRELRNLDPEEQFMALTSALGKLKDPTQQASLALQIFGRAGTKILPILKAGENEMKKLREEGRRLGFVISKEDAEAADALDDTLASLWLTMKRVTFEIGSVLGGDMKNWAQTIRDATGTIRAFIRENQAAVKTFFWVGVALAAVGTAVVSLGTALMFAAGVMKSFTIIFGTAGAASAFGILVWAGAIGLLAAAVVLLTDTFLNLFGVVDLGLVNLINNFRIGGLKIGTYFQVGWLMAMKAWDSFVFYLAEGIASVIIKIQDLFGFVKRTAYSMVSGLARAVGFTGIADSLDKSVKDSNAAMLTRHKTFNKAVGENKAQLQNYEDAIDRVVGADMGAGKLDTAKEKEKTKKAAGLEAETGLSKQEFQVMNLSRISLAGMAMGGEGNFQDVRSIGLENRLDMSNEYLRDIRNGQGLGE